MYTYILSILDLFNDAILEEAKKTIRGITGVGIGGMTANQLSRWHLV
jgi:hypothetical protein